MRRFLLGFLVAVALAVPLTLAAAPPKVVNVTNPMNADLNAANHQINNLTQLDSSTGATIELNGQGELSEYSAPGAPSVSIAAEGGFGALLQIDGNGSGTPGDILLQPARTTGYIRLNRLPTADPHVLNAVWNNAGTLEISAG